MVIDGIQPSIPENPVPEIFSAPVEEPNEEAQTVASDNYMMLNQFNKFSRKTEQVQIKTMTTHVLSLVKKIFELKYKLFTGASDIL